MIWMGTSAGAIKIFHAPTLKTKFTCTLETEGPEGTTNRTILDILYVEELRTVLVANFSGEVWIFDDDIVADGLRMQCKLELVDSSPCYHMVKVRARGGEGELGVHLMFSYVSVKPHMKRSHFILDSKYDLIFR